MKRSVYINPRGGRVEPCIRCGKDTPKWPHIPTMCAKCRIETRAENTDSQTPESAVEA